MPTGWLLLQDGRLLDCCYSINISADLLPLIPACPLVWCFYICHTCTCWCGVSLSTVPADVVPHFSYAFWCGASLSAMPAGVVPHHRSCMLVWCLIIGHDCCCVVSLLAVPADVVPHYSYAFRCSASLAAMPASVVPHYRACMYVWCLMITYDFFWALINCILFQDLIECYHEKRKT